MTAAEEGPRDLPVLMEGQLYLKGTGMVAAALFQDSLTWHRVSDGNLEVRITSVRLEFAVAGPRNGRPNDTLVGAAA